MQAIAEAIVVLRATRGLYTERHLGRFQRRGDLWQSLTRDRGEFSMGRGAAALLNVPVHRLLRSLTSLGRRSSWR